MPDQPARSGFAVSPSDLCAHAGTVDELHAGLTAADDPARDRTAGAHTALAGWRTGAELRARADRWDDQVAALGGILHDLAHRLRATGTAYASTDRDPAAEE
ncbi:hypothetical protein PUR71_13630 [Streptomyces sp. SP17BM10]|uniref:hypothetical protein n=1 Tax=Streptomyces sp. SP17BM10 TaxID=3002530 RepID=UPI002E76ADF4|nr:hypothetical protein [Streptomyces sp. SP17BM10]MEE1783939.1 hypothetical protein [Streptomyces sp. SP17BM10]